MRLRLCRCCGDFHELGKPWPHNCISHWGDRPQRSDVPAPQVIRDTVEIQSMADGKIYTSKRGLEKSYREQGLICIGNETQKARAPEKPKVTMDEIAEAVAMVKQGYKPSIEQNDGTYGTETGWADPLPETQIAEEIAA